MKSLGICYWYVNMPLCDCVEHGLEYVTFYVKKHVTPLMVCSGPPLIQDKPIGAPTFVRLAYWKPCLIPYKESYGHHVWTA